MKLRAFLLFGRTKRPDLHRGTARLRFSPLSAGGSVLDALSIVAINSRPWSFLQANPLWIAHFVAPGVAQNKKTKLISSEKKLPPRDGVPGLNDTMLSNRPVGASLTPLQLPSGLRSRYSSPEKRRHDVLALPSAPGCASTTAHPVAEIRS